VWACLHSCVGSTTRAWLLVCPNTPSFRLSSTHFFTTLHIRFSIYHILKLHIFHNVGVVMPSMIWVFISYFAYVGMNTLYPMIHFKILLELSHQRMEPMYKERFLTFSFATHEDEWILSSLETIFKPWRMLSLLIWFVQIWCNVFQ